MRRIGLTICLALVACGAFAQTFDLNKMKLVANKMMSASTTMRGCLNDGLGQDGQKRAEDAARIVKKEIRTLCKHGQPDQAYNALTRYGQSEEGKAAITCSKELATKFKDPAIVSMVDTMVPVKDIDKVNTKNICPDI